MIQNANISVVIPVLNKWNYTKQCIESLQEHSAYVNEIIVIDNDINKSSVPLFIENFKNVSIYAPGYNLGVAASWDIGIKLARNERVAVINNDIKILTHHWDIKLLEIKKELNAAIICPWPYHPSAIPSVVQQGYTAGLNGSFFLFNKATLEKTDNFKKCHEYIDTNYKFAYWEDADLLVQIRKLGLESYVTAKVQQIHFENITAGKMFPDDGSRSANNPYWVNLNYFNKKYNVKIGSCFKVHMSNILHETTNERLI